MTNLAEISFPDQSRAGNSSETNSSRARKWTGLAVAMVLAAGCSATNTPAPPPAVPQTEGQCVVGVEPAMRLVTFSAQGGLDGGVTSVFFRSMPEVAPGDLVRLEQTGSAGPRVQRIEAASPRCAEVSAAAADHHAGHEDGTHEEGAKDAHSHH